MGHPPPPSDVYVRSFLCPLSLIKLLPHKSPEWSSLVQSRSENFGDHKSDAVHCKLSFQSPLNTVQGVITVPKLGLGELATHMEWQLTSSTYRPIGVNMVLWATQASASYSPVEQWEPRLSSSKAPEAPCTSGPEGFSLQSFL